MLSVELRWKDPYVSRITGSQWKSSHKKSNSTPKIKSKLKLSPPKRSKVPVRNKKKSSGSAQQQLLSRKRLSRREGKRFESY
jgi:hypothetical protein